MFAFSTSSSVAESATVLIHRTPEAVFRFIGEEFFTNYPIWAPEVRELRQIGSGPVRAGTRARQVRVDLGHRSESIFAVTAYEPARRVCFEGVSCGYRCDYSIEAGASKCSTLLGFTFELPKLELYLRPFEALIREAIRSGVARTVQNVKQLIEAEHTAQAA